MSPKVFVSADFKQAEAVVVAWLSNDQRLKMTFKNGEDVHKLTASMMFNTSIEAVTPDQRQIGKTIRHALNYDMGVRTLGIKLGKTVSEARELKGLFHQANPHLGIWHRSIQMKLKQDMILETPYFKRRRKFLDRPGDDLYRKAYAFLPQSFVGDLLNSSLVEFYNKYGDQYTIVFQLHDGVYLSCEVNKVVELTKKLKECMIKPIEVNYDIMTIDVDFKVGPNWGAMIDLNKWLEANSHVAQV